MFRSIAEDVKQQFTYGNRITRLIIANTAVFIAINLVRLFFTLSAGFQPSAGYMDVVYFLSLSSDLIHDFTHPWVFITHMFLHTGFWHFLFNMLFLYWFGRIVGDFIGDHRVYPLYLLGGLFGAVMYLITAPLISTGGSFAYGASAAVMAFVVASGVIAPNYVMRLLFIGDVKLKYIVAALVLLDVFGIGSMSNTGGHVAHIGGALFGWIFVAALREGSDFSVPVNRFFDWVKRLSSGEKKPRGRSRSGIFVRHSSTRKGKSRTDSTPRQSDFQSRLDEILDKIKASGYESLTEEEKEFLFRASKK